MQQRRTGPMSQSTWRRRALGAAALVAIVSGCGDDGGDEGASTGATRVVQIQTDEYTFSGDPGDEIVAGETIQFTVTNIGEITHEMQVLDGTNKVLGKTERIPPGASDQVTVTFDEPGVYRVICDIDDHFTRGQTAQFTVAEPSG